MTRKVYIVVEDYALDNLRSHLDPVCNKKWFLFATILLLAVLATIAVPVAVSVINSQHAHLPEPDATTATSTPTSVPSEYVVLAVSTAQENKRGAHKDSYRGRVQETIRRLLKKDQSRRTYVIEDFESHVSFSKELSKREVFSALQMMFGDAMPADDVNMTKAIESFHQLPISSHIPYILFVPDPTMYRNRKAYLSDVQSAKDTLKRNVMKDSFEAPRIIIGDPAFFQDISDTVHTYPTNTNADQLAQIILKQLAKPVEKSTVTERPISTTTVIPTEESSSASPPPTALSSSWITDIEQEGTTTISAVTESSAASDSSVISADTAGSTIPATTTEIAVDYLTTKSTTGSPSSTLFYTDNHFPDITSESATTSFASLTTIEQKATEISDIAISPILSSEQPYMTSPTALTWNPEEIGTEQSMSPVSSTTATQEEETTLPFTFISPSMDETTTEYSSTKEGSTTWPIPSTEDHRTPPESTIFTAEGSTTQEHPSSVVQDSSTPSTETAPPVITVLPTIPYISYSQPTGFTGSPLITIEFTEIRDSSTSPSKTVYSDNTLPPAVPSISYAPVITHDEHLTSASPAESTPPFESTIPTLTVEGSTTEFVVQGSSTLPTDTAPPSTTVLPSTFELPFSKSTEVLVSSTATTEEYPPSASTAESMPPLESTIYVPAEESTIEAMSQDLSISTETVSPVATLLSSIDNVPSSQPSEITALSAIATDKQRLPTSTAESTPSLESTATAEGSTMETDSLTSIIRTLLPVITAPSVTSETPYPQPAEASPSSIITSNGYIASASTAESTLAHMSTMEETTMVVESQDPSILRTETVPLVITTPTVPYVQPTEVTGSDIIITDGYPTLALTAVSGSSSATGFYSPVLSTILYPSIATEEQHAESRITAEMPGETTTETRSLKSEPDLAISEMPFTDSSFPMPSVEPVTQPAPSLAIEDHRSMQTEEPFVIRTVITDEAEAVTTTSMITTGETGSPQPTNDAIPSTSVLPNIQETFTEISTALESSTIFLITSEFQSAADQMTAEESESPQSTSLLVPSFQLESTINVPFLTLSAFTVPEYASTEEAVSGQPTTITAISTESTTEIPYPSQPASVTSDRIITKENIPNVELSTPLGPFITSDQTGTGEPESAQPSTATTVPPELITTEPTTVPTFTLPEQSSTEEPESSQASTAMAVLPESTTSGLYSTALPFIVSSQVFTEGSGSVQPAFVTTSSLEFVTSDQASSTTVTTIPAERVTSSLDSSLLLFTASDQASTGGSGHRIVTLVPAETAGGPHSSPPPPPPPPDQTSSVDPGLSRTVVTLDLLKSTTNLMDQVFTTTIPNHFSVVTFPPALSTDRSYSSRSLSAELNEASTEESGSTTAASAAVILESTTSGPNSTDPLFTSSDQAPTESSTSVQSSTIRVVLPVSIASASYTPIPQFTASEQASTEGSNPLQSRTVPTITLETSNSSLHSLPPPLEQESAQSNITVGFAPEPITHVSMLPFTASDQNSAENLISAQSTAVTAPKSPISSFYSTSSPFTVSNEASSGKSKTAQPVIVKGVSSESVTNKPCSTVPQTEESFVIRTIVTDEARSVLTGSIITTEETELPVITPSGSETESTTETSIAAESSSKVLDSSGSPFTIMDRTTIAEPEMKQSTTPKFVPTERLFSPKPVATAFSPELTAEIAYTSSLLSLTSDPSATEEFGPHNSLAPFATSEQTGTGEPKSEQPTVAMTIPPELTTIRPFSTVSSFTLSEEVFIRGRGSPQSITTTAVLPESATDVSYSTIPSWTLSNQASTEKSRPVQPNTATAFIPESTVNSPDNSISPFLTLEQINTGKPGTEQSVSQTTSTVPYISLSPYPTPDQTSSPETLPEITSATRIRLGTSAYPDISTAASKTQMSSSGIPEQVTEHSKSTPEQPSAATEGGNVYSTSPAFWTDAWHRKATEIDETIISLVISTEGRLWPTVPGYEFSTTNSSKSTASNLLQTDAANTRYPEQEDGDIVTADATSSIIFTNRMQRTTIPSRDPEIFQTTSTVVPSEDDSPTIATAAEFTPLYDTNGSTTSIGSTSALYFSTEQALQLTSTLVPTSNIASLNATVAESTSANDTMGTTVSTISSASETFTGNQWQQVTERSTPLETTYSETRETELASVDTVSDGTTQDNANNGSDVEPANDKSSILEEESTIPRSSKVTLIADPCKPLTPVTCLYPTKMPNSGYRRSSSSISSELPFPHREVVRRRKKRSQVNSSDAFLARPWRLSGSHEKE